MGSPVRGDGGTGWEGSLPRALALAGLLPGVHGWVWEGPWPSKAGTEGHLQLLLSSLCPTFHVCYEREILGCILIKQWNFYFFFS